MGTHPIFESDFDCLTEMEVEQTLPEDIKNKCELFEENLSQMEKQLETIIGMDMKARNSLNPLDHAKIDLVSVYSMNALGWLYHIVNGADPKESQLPSELQRISASMKKVKDIEDKKKRISVDSKAAKRVVKHELHQFKKKPKTDYE